MMAIFLHEQQQDSPADMIVMGFWIRYVIHQLCVVTAALVDGDFAKTLGIAQVF
jgi:hypothetical protein